MVTQDRLKELMYYNPKTGVFTWRSDGKPRIKAGDKAGCKSLGYITIRINRRNYKAHRLAWMYIYGGWPKQIDHINHIKDDNRLINLREVTIQENGQNRLMNKNNTSGVMGVVWANLKNRWQGQIKVGGKQIHLGYFLDKFEAVCARKSAELKYGFHENHGDMSDKDYL